MYAVCVYRMWICVGSGVKKKSGCRNGGGSGGEGTGQGLWCVRWCVKGLMWGLTDVCCVLQGRGVIIQKEKIQKVSRMLSTQAFRWMKGSPIGMYQLKSRGGRNKVRGRGRGTRDRRRGVDSS